MPETLDPLNALAVLALFGVLTVAILGAWIWVILRLAFGLPALPPRAFRVVPWGAGSVLAALLVWYGTVNLATLGYALAYPARVVKARAEGGTPPPVDLMIVSALYNAATLVLVPLSLAATAGARRTDYGLAGPGLTRDVGRGILAYPLLAPVVFGVMLLSLLIWGRTHHPMEDAIRIDHSPRIALLLVLAGAVLAPAAEELVFRGVLLGWLTRIALGAGAVGRRAPSPAEVPPPGQAGSPAESPVLPAEADLDHNPYRAPVALSLTSAGGIEGGDLPGSEPKNSAFPLLLANIIVSLVFASLHGAVWPTPIPIFFLSLGLGLLYQRTGGLVAPIALHMTFNGFSTVLMLISVGMTPQKTPPAPNPIPGPAAASAESGAIAIGGSIDLSHQKAGCDQVPW